MASEENVFERVLRLAAEERAARETRPLSAAMIKAAEAHIAKHRERYLYSEEVVCETPLPD